MIRTVRWTVWAWVLAAAASAAVGAEGDSAFETLYGARYAKVKATLDRADDAALAVEFLAAGKAQGTASALAAVLLEKAHELGTRHPSGYDAAADAMVRLAEVEPARAADCLDKAAAIRQKQFDAASGADRAGAGDALLEVLLLAADAAERAGDLAQATSLCRRALKTAQVTKSALVGVIQARMDRAAARQRIEAGLASLKDRMAAAPADASLRDTAIRLCLLDLDDPVRAATFVTDACEESLRKYVPAAARGIDAAPELACTELGEWYRNLAAGADGPAQVTALERARAYFTQFLALHKAQDAQREHATLALADVDQQLRKLAPDRGGIGPGRWVNLLDLVDVAKDAQDGTWRRTQDGLRLDPSSKFARLTIPCAPMGSYQLKGVFVRQTGVNDVGFILPVGRSGTVLDLGRYAGRVHMLMDATGGSGSAKAEPGLLINENPYTVEVLVTLRGAGAEIRAVLNGRPIIQWQGPVAALSIPRACETSAPGLIGIGSAHNIVDFKSLELRMLTGVAKTLR